MLLQCSARNNVIIITCIWHHLCFFHGLHGVHECNVLSCVYPSFDVDGHKEPSQNDDHNQSLKQNKDVKEAQSMQPFAQKYFRHFPVTICRAVSSPHRDKNPFVSKVREMFVWDVMMVQLAEDYARSIRTLRWLFLQQPQCRRFPQSGRCQCCWRRARLRSVGSMDLMRTCRHNLCSHTSSETHLTTRGALNTSQKEDVQLIVSFLVHTQLIW